MAPRLPSVSVVRGLRARVPGSPSLGSLATLLAALVVGISLIPPIPFVVGTGIDPSWGVGLHLALHQGLAFGRDVVFTFGPLGFLTAPTMAYPSTGLLAYAVRIPLYAGVAWLVLRRLRTLAMTRVTEPWATLAAVLLCFPVGWTIVGPLGFGGESIVVPLIVLGAIGAERILRASPPPSMRTHVLIGIAAGAALLTKFDVGGVALALAVLFALACEADKLQRLRSTLVGAVLATIVLWVATGQPIGLLPRWLVRSFDVATGFSAAMPWAYRPGWTTAAVVAGTVLSVVAMFRGRELHWPLPFGVLYVLVLIAAFVAQSFRRYDPGHALRFVALLAVLVLVSAGRRSLVLSAVTLALLCVTALGLTQPGPAFPGFGRVRTEVPFLHPSNGWRVAWRTATFTVSGTRRNGRIAREHDRLGPAIGIPANVLAVARGKTVHVEPWETSAVWVYGWKWRPLPVFQSYSAYTASLDALNARVLGNTARAPQVVITQSLAIDGRVPRFESPDAQLALLCWYRPAASGNGWTAFTRRARSACGSVDATEAAGVPDVASGTDGATLLPSGGRRDVVSGRAEPGETVQLGGALRPGTITVVRFGDVVPKDLQTRYTAQPPGISFGDGTTHRLIAATAEGAHVFAVPACVMNALGPGAGYDATTWTSFTLTGTDLYTYEIRTLAYDCDA